MSIHATAQIHKGAQLDEGVIVGPFATIEKDTQIGRGAYIGSHAVICQGARIGRNCKVYTGAVLAGEPQDLKFKGEYSTAVIGEGTIVREYVTVSRGTGEKGETRIGKEVLLMAYVHIGHDCQIGDRCIIGNAAQLGGHCMLEDWVIVGGLAAVLQFSRMGAHAIISGGARVRKDVPPYILAAKEPPKYHGINVIGLKRRGFTAERMEIIRQIYQHLYHKGLNRHDALQHIESHLPASPEKDHIIAFIQSSDRGIVG